MHVPSVARCCLFLRWPAVFAWSADVLGRWLVLGCLWAVPVGVFSGGTSMQCSSSGEVFC